MGKYFLVHFLEVLVDMGAVDLQHQSSILFVLGGVLSHPFAKRKFAGCHSEPGLEIGASGKSEVFETRFMVSNYTQGQL